MANAGPVLLTYGNHPAVQAVVERVVTTQPAADFTADDGIGHTLWLVDQPTDIVALREAFAQEFARRAAAFGMDVAFYDPYVDAWGGYRKWKTLLGLFADCDYISMHLPLTPETEGIVDKDILDRAKDGIVVVNTGRGKTVNAEAMVAALASGKVACYATDVWPSDPPPADYPILEAPNVLMAPHIGAGTKENLLRIGEEAEQIIDAFAT